MTIGLPVHTYSVNNRRQEYYNGLTPHRPQIELIGRVACPGITDNSLVEVSACNGSSTPRLNKCNSSPGTAPPCPREQAPLLGRISHLEARHIRTHAQTNPGQTKPSGVSLRKPKQVQALETKMPSLHVKVDRMSPGRRLGRRI
ncbi:unnamed protein product [Boreogadus saida]